MVGAIKHTFGEILSELKPKHLVVGAAVLFATAWVFRRLLPGAAVRMGLNPAPLAPSYQNTLPEPFGLMPLISHAASTPAPMTSSGGPSQADLGRAIVAASQGAQSGAGDILASITAGNA